MKFRNLSAQLKEILSKAEVGDEVVVGSGAASTSVADSLVPKLRGDVTTKTEAYSAFVTNVRHDRLWEVVVVLRTLDDGYIEVGGGHIVNGEACYRATVERVAADDSSFLAAQVDRVVYSLTESKGQAREAFRKDFGLPYSHRRHLDRGIAPGTTAVQTAPIAQGTSRETSEHSQHEETRSLIRRGHNEDAINARSGKSLALWGIGATIVAAAIAIVLTGGSEPPPSVIGVEISDNAGGVNVGVNNGTIVQAPPTTTKLSTFQSSSLKDDAASWQIVFDQSRLNEVYMQNDGGRREESDSFADFSIHEVRGESLDISVGDSGGSATDYSDGALISPPYYVRAIVTQRSGPEQHRACGVYFNRVGDDPRSTHFANTSGPDAQITERLPPNEEGLVEHRKSGTILSVVEGINSPHELELLVQSTSVNCFFNSRRRMEIFSMLLSQEMFHASVFYDIFLCLISTGVVCCTREFTVMTQRNNNS